jgi:hypothetical protein
MSGLFFEKGHSMQPITTNSVVLVVAFSQALDASLVWPRANARQGEQLFVDWFLCQTRGQALL